MCPMLYGNSIWTLFWHVQILKLVGFQMAFQKAFSVSCASTHSLLYPFPSALNSPVNYVLMDLVLVYMYFNLIFYYFVWNSYMHILCLIISSTWSSPSLLVDPLPSSPLPPTSCTIFFITHQVHFVLLIYSWVWAHPQEFGAHTTPLKKSDSPSLQSHQLSIAPQLWVGTQEVKNSQGVSPSMMNGCQTQS